MKAMVLTGHGGPEMLRYGDAADPKPAADEIVVDVHAASVNAADYKVRLGGSGYNLRFPHILGRDFSGVVAARGEGVTDFAVGDAVFGVLDAGIEGAYAEKLAIKAAIVARKPDSPVSPAGRRDGVDRHHCDLGDRGHGATSGRRNDLDPRWRGWCRGFAIQLAKYLGATVVTTTSAANVDYVRSLGADRVIDYNAEDFTKTVSGCDVVFDTVGGDVQARSYSVLRPGGRLVWVAPAPAGLRPPRSDVTVLRPAVTRDRAHLERIVALLEAGAVSPPPIARYVLRTPPKRTVSAKAVTCGANWFSPFAERFERPATAQVGSCDGECALGPAWPWGRFACELSRHSRASGNPASN